MEDLDNGSPIEVLIEESHEQLRAANRAYKGAIGEQEASAAVCADAEARLAQVQEHRTEKVQSEAEAKAALIAAIDNKAELLSRARGLLTASA